MQGVSRADSTRRWCKRRFHPERVHRGHTGFIWDETATERRCLATKSRRGGHIGVRSRYGAGSGLNWSL